MSDDKQLSDLDVFMDIKRRVKITRKTRISASKRLRKKHEFYEKVTHVYSVLVLVLSVWFISGTGNITFDTNVTKILLILSLSLTFFTLYLNIKNYKERASAFETNFQQFDILLNRIERMEANQQEIDQRTLKELHGEYELLLLDKENHQEIDYYTSSQELNEKFKYKIMRLDLLEHGKNILVALYPFILLVFTWICYWIFKLITESGL
jgi:hypothetical protein